MEATEPKHLGLPVERREVADRLPGVGEHHRHVTNTRPGPRTVLRINMSASQTRAPGR